MLEIMKKIWKRFRKKDEPVIQICGGIARAKKKKKRKHIDISPIQILDQKQKTTGEILKELGVKLGKKRSPGKEKKSRPININIILDPGKKQTPPKNSLFDNLIITLKLKGIFIITNNDHLGKIRGYDIILALQKECSHRGIKTKKIRHGVKLIQ